MSIQLIQKYYAEVEKLIRYGGSRNESSLRRAFINLLESYASSKNLVLVPELELLTGAGRRVIPDGTLKDALRQDWGYWESKDETDVIEVDTYTTLSGVPAEAWEYQLGTYSALGWILERYKEKKPRDPTIREKFNTYRFEDYKEQVIDLLRRVRTVSIETMKIIGEMPE
jgi:hypothetical protein